MGLTRKKIITEIPRFSSLSLAQVYLSKIPLKQQGWKESFLKKIVGLILSNLLKNELLETCLSKICSHFPKFSTIFSKLSGRLFFGIPLFGYSSIFKAFQKRVLLWKSMFCFTKKEMFLQMVSHCKKIAPLAKSVESNFWGVSFLVTLQAIIHRYSVY